MRKIEKQVGDYLAYCEKVRRMTAVTLACKRNVLERFVRTAGVRSVREIDNAVLNRFIATEVQRGVSARSVNTYVAVIVAMIRFFQTSGVRVPVNLALVQKLKEGAVRRKCYTEEEVGLVVAKADFETGLIIRLMFETGMRIAEVANLRVDDLVGRRLKFVAKGRKVREVYLGDEVELCLRQLVAEKKITGSGAIGRTGDRAGVAIFGRTLNGEPMTTATIRNRLRVAFEEAGFKGFYPHALRHSFATGLQLKGASVEEIKEMIGHSSVATTERYLHGFEGRLEELFDKYR